MQRVEGNDRGLLLLACIRGSKQGSRYDRRQATHDVIASR